MINGLVRIISWTHGFIPKYKLGVQVTPNPGLQGCLMWWYAENLRLKIPHVCRHISRRKPTAMNPLDSQLKVNFSYICDYILYMYMYICIFYSSISLCIFIYIYMYISHVQKILSYVWFLYNLSFFDKSHQSDSGLSLFSSQRYPSPTEIGNSFLVMIRNESLNFGWKKIIKIIESGWKNKQIHDS